MRRCLGVAGSRSGARVVGVGMVPAFAAEARGRRGEAAVGLVDERDLATSEELAADAEAFLGWILSGAVLRAGGTAGAGMTFFGGRPAWEAFCWAAGRIFGSCWKLMG